MIEVAIGITAASFVVLIVALIGRYVDLHRQLGRLEKD